VIGSELMIIMIYAQKIGKFLKQNSYVLVLKWGFFLAVIMVPLASSSCSCRLQFLSKIGQHLQTGGMHLAQPSV